MSDWLVNSLPRIRIAAVFAPVAFCLPACDGEGPQSLPDGVSWVSPATPEGPTLRVAAVQFDARPQEPEHNREQMVRLCQSAAERGAELVLFHENCLLDYGPRVRELAEHVPEGPTCRRLAALAAELNLWIGAGLAEREGESVYVTHVFFGPQGFAGRYRKTWLFHTNKDRRRDEWRHFDPGTGPEALEIAGLRVVVLICSDADSARCVEGVRALKPELVLFPNNRSNLHEPGTFADLARRVGAPVVLANRSGKSWQYECNGGSCILDATGGLLARANRVGREEILVCDLPIER